MQYWVGNSYTPFSVISSIKLPDNTTSYSFDYDPIYGTISHIYFPTGGYVQFGWGIRNIGYRSTLGNNVEIAAQSTVVATDIYVSDGNNVSHWQYSY